MNKTSARRRLASSSGLLSNSNKSLWRAIGCIKQRWYAVATEADNVVTEDDAAGADAASGAAGTARAAAGASKGATATVLVTAAGAGAGAEVDNTEDDSTPEEKEDTVGADT